VNATSRTWALKGAVYIRGMQASTPLDDDAPAHRRVALWLLRQETNDADGADAIPTAAERTCQKLCVRLAKVLTAAGCQSLVARAIHLAATDAPFLRGVRAGMIPAPCLEGVQEGTRNVSPDLARAGLVAVVAHVLGLLAMFVGDDVTARLVRDVWPDAPFGREEADRVQREARP
jgi:hypothetical protein